jgi:tetratricopeptide (TPR) repeat protein
MAREYGASLLRAWARTRFVAEGGDRGGDDHARFLAFRTEFLKTYRGKPAEAEGLARPHLDPKTARAPYRAEAGNLMALLRFNQGRFADAMGLAGASRDDAEATAYQKATAAGLRVQIVSGDPKSTAANVEACHAEWLRLPYPSTEQQAKVLDVLGDFYHRKKDHDRSLKFARERLELAPAYEKGKVLNRVAMLQDLLMRPEDALASRKEAVRFLRARLGPKPERSVFGAAMTVDLFEALMGIPTATLEEKKTAANLVLGHEIVSAAVKEKVRKALAEVEKQN